MQSWRLVCVLICVVLFFSSAEARHHPQGIEGEWYIMDHKKHRPSVLIKIELAKNKRSYRAFFEEIYDSDTGKSIKYCANCAKQYDHRRVMGMPFIKGLVQQRHGYKQGKILDPRSGKWYQVMCKLKAHGTRLKVRAYLLLPMLGKTELFVRKTG